MRLFKPFFDFMIEAITHLDKEAFVRLKPHQGKVIGFEFTELSQTLHFRVLENKIEYLPEIPPNQTVHTVISGQLKDFIKIWANRTDTLNTKIHIHGDMALAEAFHGALKEIDFDWEEKLSYVLGDTLAFQLSEVAQSTRDWAKTFVKHRAQDLTEYLQYEKQCLPSQAEVSDFCKEVDILRNDVERLQQRIDKLT
ncbi:MAG: SCP2 sterol-binding domain-containing protein [Gammaproteobacteria bacterium]